MELRSKVNDADSFWEVSQGGSGETKDQKCSAKVNKGADESQEATALVRQVSEECCIECGAVRKQRSALP